MLLTPDLARTIAALGALGVEPRGERDSDTYGAPMRQVFFRLGEVILELIGQPDAPGEGDPGFFGLAITVADLDGLAGAARRAPRLGEGRRAGGAADRHAAPPRPRDVGGDGLHVARTGPVELDGQPIGGPQHPVRAGAEDRAAPAARDRQHLPAGGVEGAERPLAAELAAAADGAVGEGHACSVRAGGAVAKAVIP